MTGARATDRRRPPIRQVARCHGCQQEAEGETRFESMSCAARPVGRAIHFCDGCDAALLLAERPLEAVLLELAAAAL